MTIALSPQTHVQRPTSTSGAGWPLYTEYMKSAAWRFSTARLEELRLSEGLCRICGRGAPEVRIEVHHRCYDRLGAERVSDLTTLCQPCHTVNTKELRRRRLAGSSTKGTAPRVRPAAADRRVITGGR